MKRFFRIVVCIVLVLLLFWEIGHYTFLALQPDDMDVVTTTAEIVHASVAWQIEEWASYWVYVRPLGKGNNEELLLFTVGTFTETESPLTLEIEKMPELAAGQAVEITHTHKMLRSVDRQYGDEKALYVRGYEALSIKRTTEPYSDRQTVLQETEGWRLNFLENNDRFPSVSFTVNYVAKITYPMYGYILYGDDNRFSNSGERTLFDCYFVRGDMFMSRKLRKKLENREVGYDVLISDCWSPVSYAFRNLDAKVCDYIKLEEDALPSTSDFIAPKLGDGYAVYNLSNYNKEGFNRRIDIDEHRASKLYYYIKLDSGSLKIGYDNMPFSFPRYQICEVSADDEAKEGYLVSSVFSASWYLDVERVGSEPVNGTLIVSYVPLDEIDYDFDS